MRRIEISERDRKMLHLLSQGSSGKVVAKKLGYSDGTTRVYLHMLYQKIGVDNKTAAVVWYFDRLKAEASRGEAAAVPTAPTPPSAAPTQSVGDFALKTSLYTALGAMGIFIGPFGRMWQVAQRLKGVGIDGEELQAERAQCRLLWEALLKADFSTAKQLYDESDAVAQALGSPERAALLGLLLLLGGYTAAGERVFAERRRFAKGRANEGELLSAVREAVGEPGSRWNKAIGRIYEIAARSGPQDPVRHLALAALYQLYRAQRDDDRAKQVAEFVWAEAEACRQQLQAMGDHAFYRNGALSAPGTGTRVKAPKEFA